MLARAGGCAPAALWVSPSACELSRGGGARILTRARSIAVSKASPHGRRRSRCVGRSSPVPSSDSFEPVYSFESSGGTDEEKKHARPARPLTAHVRSERTRTASGSRPAEGRWLGRLARGGREARRA